MHTSIRKKNLHFHQSAVILTLGLALSIGSVAETAYPTYAAEKTATKKVSSGVKAHATYYHGIAHKGAKLTALDKDKTIILKKNSTVKIVERGKDTYTVQYKNKKYTVKSTKVSRGSMMINSRAYGKTSVENYVNKKKFKSPTKYMLWISLSSQHIYVFKGKQGHWKQVRSFICSTGKPGTETPYGKTKIKGKQPVWYWYGTPCAYHASRIAGGAIHSWSSGGFGYPRSHGCVRCNGADALYVYRTIPVNSSVYII